MNPEQIADIYWWVNTLVGAIIGIIIGAVTTFIASYYREKGRQFAMKGVTEQITRSTEEIKNQIRERSVRSGKRQFLIEDLRERLENARVNMERHYRNRPLPPGYIVNGETLATTEIISTLRLHEVELGEFYKPLYDQWDLVAHHIWPRDQPEESFQNNLKKFNELTKQVGTLTESLG